MPNVTNMPTETEDDRQELYGAIQDAKPANRVIFILHSTPFRPSPATPMEHCEVSLTPTWHRKTGKDAIICDRPDLLAMHSRQMESPRSHLETVIIERATPTEESDRLFHAISFAPKLVNSPSSGDWLRRVTANFDLEPYLRRYDPEEKTPTWFLSGWIGRDDMLKAKRWITRQLC